MALAQGLVKPEGFEVKDRPDDGGRWLVVVWRESPSDAPGAKYVLFGSTSEGGPWTQVAEVDSKAPEGFQNSNPKMFWLADLFEQAKHRHYLEIRSIPHPTKANHSIPLWNASSRSTGPKRSYYFRLEMVRESTGERLVVGSGDAQPIANLWDSSKSTIFLGCVGFCALVLTMIRRARKNPDMFVRRIPGLDAVDEAIGRATEMGKPVLYLNGLLGMESISTIASTSILGRLARRIAQYDSQILVPCYDPVVLPICQEIVREAYLDAGRPDAFREESIYFLSNDQFSYVAAVDGIMMRDKPAANFYMGYYYAESLLLAETGAATGAIQIAGTDSVTQLPFFIAACDYTLIGEELYAASAYLSRDPMQLGSLKGLDYGKAVLIAMLLVGTLLVSFELDFVRKLFATF